MSTCPSCSAMNVLDHPAGVLVFSHDPACPIGNAEDSTRANDHELVTKSSYRGALPYPAFTRVTTTAENELLVALGYLPAPVTTVTRITAGGAVVNRSFGQLVQRPHVANVSVTATGAGTAPLHIHRATVSVTATGTGEAVSE